MNFVRFGNADTTCRDDQISCDGECHPLSIRCDGIFQCTDGRDEENCGRPTGEQSTQSPSSSTQAPSVVHLFFQPSTYCCCTMQFNYLYFLWFCRLVPCTSVLVKKLVSQMKIDAMVVISVVMAMMNTGVHVSWIIIW